MSHPRRRRRRNPATHRRTPHPLHLSKLHRIDTPDLLHDRTIKPHRPATPGSGTALDHGNGRRWIIVIRPNAEFDIKRQKRRREVIGRRIRIGRSIRDAVEGEVKRLFAEGGEGEYSFEVPSRASFGDGATIVVRVALAVVFVVADGTHVFDLPAEQHAGLEPQLRASGVDFDFGSVGHAIEQTEEGGFVFAEARGVDIVGANVAEEEGAVGEEGGYEALTELGGAVVEFEGVGFGGWFAGCCAHDFVIFRIASGMII
mmetsp:Transcript_2116/g.4048  ORF Transcript_2116/g.4048 Transcript_2116/m.4048 type:complete len:258 (+) Transcript_2116:680-1453(+)